MATQISPKKLFKVILKHLPPILAIFLDFSKSGAFFTQFEIFDFVDNFCCFNSFLNLYFIKNWIKSLRNEKKMLSRQLLNINHRFLKIFSFWQIWVNSGHFGETECFIVKWWIHLFFCYNFTKNELINSKPVLKFFPCLNEMRKRQKYDKNVL